MPVVPSDPDLLFENACWPKSLGSGWPTSVGINEVDPGYALKADDLWNLFFQIPATKYYRTPPFALTSKCFSRISIFLSTCHLSRMLTIYPRWTHSSNQEKH